MAKILVADKLSPQGVEILKAAGLEVEVKTGLDETALIAALAHIEGLVVRSATKVTRKVIEGAPKLKIVGRAGVGVDNVDAEAATARGIIVMNTPLGNITSAAEHAVALLFAVARHVPQADARLKAGGWDKNKFTGVELTGKTLGVIGLGKVAAIVIGVARSLQMHVLACDPYVTQDRVEALGAHKVELEELLAQSDFVTIHTPLTDETRGMIDEHALSLMKPTARLVNCARGGIVSEPALVAALQEKKIAGAALDVFATEPLPPDSPLRKLDNVVLTPHLGASTDEAQERVATDLAHQFADYFTKGIVRNAVNLHVTLDRALAPYAELADLLGQVLAQIATDPVRLLKVGCYGKLADYDTHTLALYALRGLLKRSAGEEVNLINAPLVAEARGIKITEKKSAEVRNYLSLIVLQANTKAGEHSLGGTLFDGRDPRLVRLEGFDIDLKPAANMLLMIYPDRPGMVGRFGTILGKADINIAGMEVGRREKRGQAAVVLTLDDPLSDAVIKEIGESVQAERIHRIRL